MLGGGVGWQFRVLGGLEKLARKNETIGVRKTMDPGSMLFFLSKSQNHRTILSHLHFPNLCLQVPKIFYDFTVLVISTLRNRARRNASLVNAIFCQSNINASYYL